MEQRNNTPLWGEYVREIEYKAEAGAINLDFLSKDGQIWERVRVAGTGWLLIKKELKTPLYILLGSNWFESKDEMSWLKASWILTDVLVGRIELADLVEIIK